MHSRQEGTVKWFDQRHGIGVICAEGQRWDYLVLRCAVGDAGLAAGERVSFEPVNKALGCWAFNVIRRG
ncbi:Cold shock-like protein CspE [compost metagenome]